MLLDLCWFYYCIFETELDSIYAPSCITPGNFVKIFAVLYFYGSSIVEAIEILFGIFLIMDFFFYTDFVSEWSSLSSRSLDLGSFICPNFLKIFDYYSVAAFGLASRDFLISFV